MQFKNFIDDDEYLPGYIAGVAGFYGPCRFTFRPLLAADRASLSAKYKEHTADACERLAAEAVAKNLGTWDVQNKKKEVVPITPANVSRLHPAFWKRLHEIVMGFGPSDTDPEWPEEKKQQLKDYQFCPEGDGQTPGERREGDDEKK